MAQNTFLYFDAQSAEGVIIDAGCGSRDLGALAEAISGNRVAVKALLLTHGHYDHISAADGLKTLTRAPVCCHEAEKTLLAEPEINLSAYTGREIRVTPDRLLRGEDVFAFAGAALRVLHTPGHTPGGVCYYDEANGVLFAGDTLFRGSVGRADFPLGDYNGLLESIAARLLTLPEDTVVYAGHGEKTTIGHEKRHNPFL
jgi:glyoxylase-like metal-dependent hydrolase (beta-lactamase superfamily II)